MSFYHDKFLGFCAAVCMISALTIPTRAFSFASNPDEGRPSFLQLVQEAIDDNDLNALEKLLNNPPQGNPFPLSEAKGTLVFALFNLLVKQGEDEKNRAEKILKLTDKALKLGASAKKMVPRKRRDGRVIEAGYVATDALILQWKFLVQANPGHVALIAKRAKQFFDILLSAGQVSSDDGFSVDESSPEGLRVTRKYWQIPFFDTGLEAGFPKDIYYYFLAKKPEIKTTNSLGLNTPMLIVLDGDLNALRAFADSYDPAQVAQAFNFKSTAFPYEPTVLHMAIAAVNKNVSAEQIIKMIELLVSKGADPGQRSLRHNLVQETKYWARENPSTAQTSIVLAHYLQENLPRLQRLFKQHKQQGNKDCGLELKTEPPDQSPQER